MRILAIFLILVGAAVGGVVAYAKFYRTDTGGNFRTATVTKGDLTITVGATGTVEPEEVVDVGAQVVGRVMEFGDDPRSKTDPKFKGKRIDYGSPVEEGTVLANIDKAVYQAQWDQAQATLQHAQADLGQMEAKLVQAEAEWKRAEKLRNLPVNKPSNGSAEYSALAMQIQGISDSDYVLAKANYEVAKANVEVGKSTIEQQKAEVKLAKNNLDFTVIQSPVKGTIIDRRVNIGQTVVSSLNAPSLFLIAKDLKRMQVWASVNEADIGRVVVGTPANFTVDAFPNDTFHGTVTQIRFNATMTQNVVTYTVVVTFDNSELKLIPYLTADVKFEVDKRQDVFLVPNAALRYQPRPELIAPSSSGEESSAAAEGPRAGGGPVAGGPGGGGQRDPRAGGQRPGGGGKRRMRDEHAGTVWVQDGGLLLPMKVEVGVSDGLFTQVTGDQVQEGLEVVLGENRDEPAAQQQVNNPFAPQFPGRRR